jgi:LAO/AO transport system kinase
LFIKNNPLTKRTLPDIQTLTSGILSGDRYLLSRAITLTESSLPQHRQMAQEVIAACLPFSGKSRRIGITGSPGVGKSTFIEALGMYITDKDHRLAVLTIDPTSPVSKGSILGDKTRMAGLSVNEKAYIRPSPSGTWLGGVARMTRETMILCEAAGFDTIFVETVGVGQSEFAVRSMTDFFILLLLPGAGDELQGIKRGIVEMADLVVINKADDDRLPLARQARLYYHNALHLFPPKSNGWMPDAILCSSLQNTGIPDVWAKAALYFLQAATNGFLEENRRQQSRNWLYDSIMDALKTQFLENEMVRAELPALEKAVLENRISPFAAAEELMRRYRGHFQS